MLVLGETDGEEGVGVAIPAMENRAKIRASSSADLAQTRAKSEAAKRPRLRLVAIAFSPAHQRPSHVPAVKEAGKNKDRSRREKLDVGWIRPFDRKRIH